MNSEHVSPAAMRLEISPRTASAAVNPASRYHSTWTIRLVRKPDADLAVTGAGLATMLQVKVTDGPRALRAVSSLSSSADPGSRDTVAFLRRSGCSTAAVG